MIQQSSVAEEPKKVYVVWNNKGGVGKSTIVFNLAARYAQLNPKRHVLVLDLCPQANSTTIAPSHTPEKPNPLTLLSAT